jgi:ABC-type sugar transport system ATPase subunit
VLEGAEIGFETEVELPPRTTRPPRLQVRGLSLKGSVDRVSFDIAPGECLGIYGFVGAGHQDVVHALAGATRHAAGEILVDGRAIPQGRTDRAVAAGMVMVAADRGQTLVHRATVGRNVTMAHLRAAVGRWITSRRETRQVVPLLERVACKPARADLLAASLSGGNQQKVVVAKWLLGPVRVLLLDEPTRGMDVGAKDEVMRLVSNLKNQGAAVLLASSEPELLLANADRIAVMSRGRFTCELSGTRVDKSSLVRAAG